MKKKRIIYIKLILLCMTLFLCIQNNVTAAAPFDYTIYSTESSDYDNIVNFLDVYSNEQIKEKILYLISGSEYAPLGGDRFTYPNYGSSSAVIVDENDPYGIYYYSIPSGTGCWAYSCFVESFIFGYNGSDGHSIANYRLYSSDMPEYSESLRLKYLIQNYAQPGEHLRIGDYHSFSFIAYDGDGFYFMDYWGSGYSEPYPITLHYARWDTFCSYFNADNVFLYESDERINNITIKDAFPDNVFRDYIKTVVLNDSFLPDDSPIAFYLSTIAAQKELNIAALGIKDLNGIEYFKSLESLNCSHNDLTYLDISKNVKLTDVKCDGNMIRKIENMPDSVKHFDGGIQNIETVCKINADKTYVFEITDLSEKDIVSLNGALMKDGRFVLAENTKFPNIVVYKMQFDCGEMIVDINVKYDLQKNTNYVYPDISEIPKKAINL